VGRDGVVDIATHYGPNSLGNEIQWRWNFLHPSRLALAPPVSYTMGTWSFLGVKWLVHGINHPPFCSAGVKENVELYTSTPPQCLHGMFGML